VLGVWHDGRLRAGRAQSPHDPHDCAEALRRECSRWYNGTSYAVSENGWLSEYSLS